VLKRLLQALLGESKDPLDARVFHQVSLVAFLAWVGLGADGLSSSAYGPEQAYRALGAGHGHLAVFLALATAFTVAVICVSYAQVIELFPTGGGGYLVASKLLGSKAGLVAGSALVVNYTFTISISIAAGSDALFSFLPPEWAGGKLGTQLGAIALLIWLNLRGVKESVTVLVPIFLLFIATHALLIFGGLAGHVGELPGLAVQGVQETQLIVDKSGWWALFVILFTAYSMGGGTYTGIEAVSNGMGSMREPKVRTGRRAMLYTGVSLAVAAAGILVGYMLYDVQPTAGKTMNASLAEAVFGSWSLGGFELKSALVWVTMGSAALLLFIASQTGFLGGAAVLANMASDSWVPHQFSNLSNRLVTRNGILGMGGAALAINWFSGGDVSLLVVMYSINVFVGFCLTQLGMSVHWWNSRGRGGRDWLLRFAVSGTGLALTSAILVATIIFKFSQGGWVTLLITGSLIGLCLWVRSHYRKTKQALRRLDDLLINLPIPEVPAEYRAAAPEGPTAVLLVNKYDGLGIHAIFSIRKLFKSQEFKNLIFVSVGQIDSARFKGVEEIENLRQSVKADLDRYVDLAQRMGYYSEHRFALGTDRVSELQKLCTALADDFVEPIIFCGKLVFAEESGWTRALHNQTALEIQRRLMFAGLNTIVVPVRVL
jgi:amino acid transporter